MRTLTLMLCFALSTGAHLSAAAADTGAACKNLSSGIAAQSAAFLKINGAVSSVRVSAASPPELALRRMDHKDVALDAAANEIWFLRTRMVNLGCADAAQFQF